MGYVIYQVFQVKVSQLNLNALWEIQKHNKAGIDDE